MHTPLEGRLYVISGASRTGKTAWVRRQVQASKRVAAWDPEGQWADLRGWRTAETRRELLDHLKKPKPVKVAYVASANLKAEFGFWSACVFQAGRSHGEISAVAEELGDVSTVGKAPDDWGILVRRGLKYGITLYAISQRWAEADKTAFGNASDYIVFRLSSHDDVRYIARKTRIPEAEMLALAPKLEYLHATVEGGFDRSKLRF